MQKAVSQRAYRRHVWVLALALFLMVLPAVSTAQFQAGQGSATLELDPRNPRPTSQVEVSLNAYSFDQSGATIRWYVDGALQSEFNDRRSLPVETGALGSAQTVRADLTLRNGQRISASRTIRPADVDLVVESTSYTPNFYRGRALPSNGADVRIVAVPHIPQNYARDELVYEWTINNNVALGGPTRGAESYTFTLSFMPVDVGLAVYTPSGEYVTGNFITIDPAQPEVHFYGTNPLRGVLPNALASPYTLSAEEITLRAEPYFMPPITLQGNGRSQWHLDSAPIENTDEDPQLLTLRQTGGSGEARISYELEYDASFIQRARGALTITFGE